MRLGLRRLPVRLGLFAADAAGNIVLVFGLGAPLLFGFVGVAVDYAAWANQATVLQKAADSAALAAANELRVAEPDRARIQSIAETVVKGQVKLERGDGPVAVATKLIADKKGKGDDKKHDDPEGATTVQVTLSQRKNAIMSRIVTPELTDIEVSATANLVGGTKICVVGLDDKAPDTLRLADSARISAGGCSVDVNSTSPSAVRSEHQAQSSRS